MSYSTYKNRVIAVLDDNGYKRIPENKDPDDTKKWQDKSYSLKPVGAVNTVYYTGQKIQYDHLMELRIKYKAVTANQLDEQYQAWVDITDSMSDETNFREYGSDREFNEIDEKHYEGVVTLIFGSDSTC